MARKKGRDIHGWLIVDKPAGIGSTDVVSKVRWALDAKKAGHAGTLDPDATGVLAVALGEDRFADLMSGMIVNWHLSGRILALETEYGVDNTPFAERMHQLFLDINPSIER